MQTDLHSIPDPAYFTDEAVQRFLREHAQEDPSVLALHYTGKTGFDIKPTLTQLKLRRKAAEKLPDWFAQDCLFAETALEQCSSQLTARWKAEKANTLLHP